MKVVRNMQIFHGIYASMQSKACLYDERGGVFNPVYIKRIYSNICKVGPELLVAFVFKKFRMPNISIVNGFIFFYIFSS